MFEQKNLKLFEEIYNKTYNSLLKHVILKCSNMDDVNDIIQDTYLEFYNKLLKNTKIKDYNSYLRGICKNIIKKHYKAKYKKQEIYTDISDDDLRNIKDEKDLELDFFKKEDVCVIYKYLQEKNVLVFKVFYLFYHDEVSIKEIASLLEISVSKTKNILYRTLKELKALRGELI